MFGINNNNKGGYMDSHTIKGNTANRGVFALLGFVLQVAGALAVGAQIIVAMVWATSQIWSQMMRGL